MSAEEARRTLHKLVDFAERRPPADRQRAIQRRLPDRFASVQAREAFEDLLRGAAERGAVALERHRGEAAHLYAKVRLADLDALYRYLDRTPAQDLAEAAARDLDDLAGTLDRAAPTAHDMATAWRQGRQHVGLGRDDIAEAKAFLHALEAVLRADFAGRDMRTVAVRRLGDSKAIERHAARIARVLRARGDADPAADDWETLAAIGLEKFPPEVRCAGPVTIAGAAMGALTFVAVPPEHVPDVTVPAGAPLVTVENLASFNRYVREARTAGEVVVYTGGFPSRGVAALLHALRDQVGTCHHWGDIDATGLRIAADVGRHLGAFPWLWCMDAETARTYGQPAPATGTDRLPDIDRPDARALAAFLASDRAHVLEQERLDPVSPWRTS
jgi:hypothetical protein